MCERTGWMSKHRPGPPKELGKGCAARIKLAGARSVALSCSATKKYTGDHPLLSLCISNSFALFPAL